MASNNGDTGAFMVGFVIGALVGAAAALIMAPQSGEETRQQIRDKGVELKGQAEDELRAAIARAETAAEQARARMLELQAELEARSKAAVDDARKQVTDLADETKGRVSKAVEQGKAAARKTREELTGTEQEVAAS
jgi:gas vesicle protein